jgi:hypothetical protein
MNIDDARSVVAARLQEGEDVVTLINLTPHPLNLLVGDGSTVTLDPHLDMETPRVEDITEPDAPIVFKSATGWEQIPTNVVVPGDVMNLPDPQPGVCYIVSRITAEAPGSGGRTDLYFPTDLARGDKGQIVGCRALGRLPDAR